MRCSHDHPTHVSHCCLSFFLIPLPHPPTSTLFPYTTLFRSLQLVHPPVAAALLGRGRRRARDALVLGRGGAARDRTDRERERLRSEEHTSELQSRGHLVCRLLLEKKKKNTAI